MLYKKIDSLQFDLNVTCNAYCPGCHRHTMVNGEMYMNPYLPFNTSIDIDVIDRALQSPRLIEDIKVDFVGLVGEPIAHQEFLDIIDIVYKRKPYAKVNIHTNGGLRSVEFFKELAEKLKQGKNDAQTQFAIDGLEDTNHLYRVGVNWDKIMENMQAFIDAGGIAIWKYLIFPHNSHQVEQARELGTSMGIRAFRPEKNRDEGSELFTRYMEAYKKFHPKTLAPKGHQSPRRYEMKEFQLNPVIKNRCFDEEAIYINYEGKVLPCCMFNSGLTDESYMDEMVPYINGNNPDWNSLYHNSFEDIMQNNWWQSLYNDLTTTPCTVCVHSCKIN
jgi:MoaA/NifB/PqqE/SkfB family radical SAM enzyme